MESRWAVDTLGLYICLESRIQRGRERWWIGSPLPARVAMVETVERAAQIVEGAHLSVTQEVKGSRPVAPPICFGSSPARFAAAIEFLRP